MSGVQRLIVGLWVLPLVLWVSPTPAFAHAEFLGSAPASGSHLSSMPGKITLRFGENLSDLSGANAIVVMGPGGEEISQGEVSIMDTSAARDLKATSKAGTYHVAYRVLSADGHPVSGELDFFLDEPGVPTPLAGPASSLASPASSLASPASSLASPASSRAEQGQKSFLSVHKKQLLLIAMVLFTLTSWFLFEVRARKRRILG